MDPVNLFKAAREYLTPLLTESAFLKSGVLNPEEFVLAGDNLVHNCPTWSWSSGEKSKIKSYFPENKQFLITKGVPCYRRVSDLNQDVVNETSIEAVGMEDNWCATDIITGHAEAKAPAEDSVIAAEDDYPDMMAYEDSSASLDDASANISKLKVSDDATIKSRRYDVSIVYDKYYRTPRVYLFGYDERGNPLRPEDIFSDIMTDYANRTVTIETHPHLSRQHASIHPCQHAAVMKTFIDALLDNGFVPSVDQYLFIFLKFVQGVVPTIEYDYTSDVQIQKIDTITESK